MSDEAALLRAIHAHPDDDTPRLVYADWLDDHGQPERAEFIRLQIEWARSSDDAAHRRADELLVAHRSAWTAHHGARETERVWVGFRRGFPASLTFHNAEPTDFEILKRFPEVRRIAVEIGNLSLGAVRAISGLKQLDALSVEAVPFRPKWLPLLDALPCWAYVRIYDDDNAAFWRAWEAFQERRDARVAAVPVAERREAARRFLCGFYNSSSPRPGEPITDVRFSQMGLRDAELRLVSYLTELESVSIVEGYETEAGVRHLAALPKLKVLKLSRTPITSLAPVTGFTALEELTLMPDDGDITDAGTAALETLPNLRKLSLWPGLAGFGDETVRRLAKLKHLRDLELRVCELTDDSLSAIARCTKLERVSMDGPLTDDDLRHFAGLTNLRFLSMNGTRATDTGLMHLRKLTKLRTLVAQHDFGQTDSQLTEDGARALAAVLPEVTIILQGAVVKSPRKEHTFQRRTAGGFASALVPTYWKEQHGWERSLHFVEDGWEGVGSWSGGVVGRGEFRLYVADAEPKHTAEAALKAHRNANSHANPRVLERDSVKLRATGDTASCVYRNDFGQYLVCAVVRDGKCVTLSCEAPKARFAEFRPLFEYVARSLLTGSAALKSEDKTVLASRL